MAEHQDLIIRVFTVNVLRYFIPAGLAFLICYIWLRTRWKHKKIQPKFPEVKEYHREIIYSIFTIIVFVTIALLTFLTPLSDYTLRYEQISTHGWGYWMLSIALMLVLHDTYFYWMHRLMHWHKVFKYVHRIHHKSTNPSPWAAYAFHPLEAIVEAGIIFPIVFFIPFHISALLVFLLLMIIYNVYGHLGFELFPKQFNRHPIGRWINTSVNHNQHHKHFEGNYGLYTLLWDRLMGTLRTDYDAAYEQVDERR